MEKNILMVLIFILLQITFSHNENTENIIECTQKETKIKCLADNNFQTFDSDSFADIFQQITKEQNLSQIEQALLKLQVEQKINSDLSELIMKDLSESLLNQNEKQYEQSIIDEKIINLQIYLEQMKQKSEQEIENYYTQSIKSQEITQNFENQIKEDQQIYEVLEFKFRNFYQKKHSTLKFLIEYVNDYIKNNKQILNIFEPFLQRYETYINEKASSEDKQHINIFLDEQKSYSDAKLIPISQQSSSYIQKLFKQIITQGPKTIGQNVQNQISYLQILKQQSQLNINQNNLEKNIKSVFDYHFVSNEEIEDYDYNELQKTLTDQFFLNKRKQYQQEQQQKKRKSGKTKSQQDDILSEDYNNIQFYELSLEGIINEDKWISDQTNNAIKDWQKLSSLPQIETILRIFRILQQKQEAMNTMSQLTSLMNIWYSDILKYATIYKDSILQKHEEIQFNKLQLELHDKIYTQDEKIHQKQKILFLKDIKNLEKQLLSLYEYYSDDQLKVNQFKQSRQFLKSIDIKELLVNTDHLDLENINM